MHRLPDDDCDLLVIPSADDILVSAVAAAVPGTFVCRRRRREGDPSGRDRGGGRDGEKLSHDATDEAEVVTPATARMLLLLVQVVLLLLLLQ